MDIVERLKTATVRFASEDEAQAKIRRNNLIKEAAAEITRLRAEIASLRESFGMPPE